MQCPNVVVEGALWNSEVLSSEDRKAGYLVEEQDPLLPEVGLRGGQQGHDVLAQVPVRWAVSCVQSVAKAVFGVQQSAYICVLLYVEQLDCLA